MTASEKKVKSVPVAGRFSWLWGILGAVLLAVVVGVGVWFVMYRAYSQSIDTIVDLRVKEQMDAQKGGPPPAPPASVKVAQVSEQRAQQRVTVVGRLKEVRRSVIASEVEGRVVELLTPAGREVIGGKTIIARVDPVWSGLAFEQAKADLAAAEATARQSKRELAHLEELALRSAADPQTIDDAKAKSEADAANVLARMAALHRAEETSKRVEITAPFDGIVIAKLTEQGQWLDPGTPVVEIVSRGLIDAVIDVPEQIITEVPVGTDIEIAIEPLNQTLTGKVVAINPDGSNAARTFPVKVRIDDQGGLLKVGMSVTARVPVLKETDFLVVPRDAVQYADNGPQVWMSLVMPQSAPGSMPQAIPMDVNVLFGLDGLFAIQPKPKVEGMLLMPGMDVVIEGAERLWPTRPLIIMPAGSGPPVDQANGSVPTTDSAGAERG